MRLAIVVLLGLVARAHAGDLDALTVVAPGCYEARARCRGLGLQIAVGEGGPVATEDWITAQLAGANRHFAELDTGFQIVSVDALPASATRVEDRRERSELGRKLPGTAVHVFVTGHLDDVDTAGEMAYGVTWRTGSKKFIILSTQAFERTLAHELGHVFGLPHSTYAISIMNKTPRDQPPVDQRTFAAEEIARMRPRLAQLLRARVIANLKARR
ncbi:MAG: matrixin family metalloprotease [Kofleriaceae bacterium]